MIMFFGNIVSRISTVTGRDLCMAKLAADPRSNEIPTLEAAEQLSRAWKAERNWYVEPHYLLEVWLEFFKKAGYTDSREENTV